jgi:hypothetical protein
MSRLSNIYNYYVAKYVTNYTEQSILRVSQNISSDRQYFPRTLFKKEFLYPVHKNLLLIPILS